MFGIPQKGETANFEQTLATWEAQRAAFSDISIIYEDQISKGNKVVGRYRVKVTHTGDLGGLPATGNTIEIGGIEIIRIENGRIVEIWEAIDWLDFYQQLGFELKPKETKK
jgi:predicted ester cyclase